MKQVLLFAVQSVLLTFAAAGSVSTNAARATFSVTTAPSKGKYTPHHVLAIWVTDSKDAFVQTLRMNANKRKKHLIQWLAALGDTNKVDAVTSATLKEHRPLTVVWDCKDAQGNLVPEGKYRIRVEFTEANGAGPASPKNHIEFTVGPEAATVKPKDLVNFKNMSVVYTPAKPKPTKSQ